MRPTRKRRHCSPIYIAIQVHTLPSTTKHHLSCPHPHPQTCHHPYPHITFHIHKLHSTSKYHHPHLHITIHTSHSTWMWHYPCKHMAIQVHSLQSSCLPSFHSWRNLELEKKNLCWTSILVGGGILLPHPKVHGIQHLCLLWEIWPSKIAS